jgi:hypothetical protein
VSLSLPSDILTFGKFVDLAAKSRVSVDQFVRGFHRESAIGSHASSGTRSCDLCVSADKPAGRVRLQA